MVFVSSEKLSIILHINFMHTALYYVYWKVHVMSAARRCASDARADIHGADAWMINNISDSATSSLHYILSCYQRPGLRKSRSIYIYIVSAMSSTEGENAPSKNDSSSEPKDSGQMDPKKVCPQAR